MRLIKRARVLSDRIENQLQENSSDVPAWVRERAQVVIAGLRENIPSRNGEQLRQGFEELRQIEKMHFPKATKAAPRAILEFVGLVVLASFFLRAFIVSAFTITTSSMDPTLAPGDVLLVWKSAYAVNIPFTGLRLLKVCSPRRWQVVVFSTKGLAVERKDHGKPYVKRIVGLPGEEIEIENGQIYVNGSLAAKPKGLKEITYVGEEMPAFGGAQKIKVPSGMYFVLGDNTDDSQDSRFWGFLPEKNIRGRAFVVFFPWNRRHSI